MGRRKRKRTSSRVTRRLVKGFFTACCSGLMKTLPFFSLATLAAGIFWGIRSELYADPGFRVKTIEIVPQGLLSAARTKDLERHYLQQNLFTLSLEEVVRRVEADPQIGEVRVFREFPSALRITVVPRNPFGQIQWGGKGRFYWVAEDGMILGEDASRKEDTLLIQASEAKEVKVNTGMRVSLPGLQEGMSFARRFSKHTLARTEKIDTLYLDHLGNVNLLLKDGPELRFGRNPMKRLETLDLLTPFLKGAARDRIVYLDLQYKDVIVKKK